MLQKETPNLDILRFNPKLGCQAMNHMFVYHLSKLNLDPNISLTFSLELECVASLIYLLIRASS